MAYVAAGDSAGIANLYTADAKLMFAGKPADVLLQSMNFLRMKL
ncbi:hypothetical protein [Aquiflexum sp.]